MSLDSVKETKARLEKEKAETLGQLGFIGISDSERWRLRAAYTALCQAIDKLELVIEVLSEDEVE